MPTSVHIPKPLLDAVDRRAHALRISRNRLIVQALERELSEGADWSAGFFERLSEVDEATAGAVDEMLATVRAARRSKAPRTL
jgi:predicted transcriptional regulator